MELAVMNTYHLSCACIGIDGFVERDQRDAAAQRHVQCPGQVTQWEEGRLIWLW